MTASTRSLSSSSSQVAECGCSLASYCMANSSCNRPTVRSSCSIVDAPNFRSSTNRTMVVKRKLTIETLSKLGRRRLAELLIAEAAGNRQLTQTLNFAISAEEGPAALGASLRKRLATLAKSRSMLSYDNGRDLTGELDGLRTTI